MVAAFFVPFGWQIFPMNVPDLVFENGGKLHRVTSAQPVVAGIHVDAQSSRVAEAIEDGLHALY
jgi:hypothetical protein